MGAKMVKEVASDGEPIGVRDYQVEAAIKAAQEKEEANNQIFNVGTGTPTDVYTVAKQLIENYRKEVPITISGNYRLGDIRHNFADITKISSMLNFVPKISFNQGLEKFTNWVNSQEIQEDYYQKSIEEMKAKGLYK